jgi:hypothetical protein
MTTPLKDFATLADAKIHTEPFERMLSPDMVINFLTVYNSLNILLSSTDEKAKGLVFAIQAGVSDFNLMNSHPIGRGQQQLIGYLVAIGALTSDCRDACVGYANTTRKPYANETKQSFDIAKGTISRTQVTVEQGFCSITTTADCEKHNPQIYRKVTFVNGTFEYVRVAGFSGVEAAKTYRVQCPSFPDLYVDDAYGVVG